MKEDSVAGFNRFGPSPFASTLLFVMKFEGDLGKLWLLEEPLIIA